MLHRNASTNWQLTDAGWANSLARAHTKTSSLSKIGVIGESAGWAWAKHALFVLHGTSISKLHVPSHVPSHVYITIPPISHKLPVRSQCGCRRDCKSPRKCFIKARISKCGCKGNAYNHVYPNWLNFLLLLQSQIWMYFLFILFSIVKHLQYTFQCYTTFLYFIYGSNNIVWPS